MTRLKTIRGDRNGEKNSILNLTSSKKVCRPVGLMMMLMVAISREKLASRCGVPWMEKLMACEVDEYALFVY
jgi:hypothetical protein